MSWVLLALPFVVIIAKYYTAKQGVLLERRLRAVQRGLREMREMFRKTQEKLESAKAGEQAYEERISHLKETIEDLKMRLTAAG